MKNLRTIASIVIALMILPLQAQIKQAVLNQSKVSVTGTSTIHDWEMEVNNYKSTANLVINENVISISKSTLNFKTVDLKSSSSGLDNKAHEALNASKYPTISFIQNGDVSATLNGNKFNATVAGKLTVAGQSKPVALKTEGVILADGTVKVKGSIDKKMSEFGVTPPRAMMGAIRSGDEINIQFEVIYK